MLPMILLDNVCGVSLFWLLHLKQIEKLQRLLPLGCPYLLRYEDSFQTPLGDQCIVTTLAKHSLQDEMYVGNTARVTSYGREPTSCMTSAKT